MAKGGAKILFGLLFFILLVGGLAGGGAWYLTENRPVAYRATALLLLEPDPEAVSSPPSTGGDPLRTRIEAALGIEMNRSASAGIAAPDFATLFQADDMAGQLAAKLEAVYVEKGLPAPTMDQVKAAMNAATNVALQTPDHVSYDRVIQLHYTAENPDIAATGANTWAGLCTEYAAKLAEMKRTEREAPLTAEVESVRAAHVAAASNQATLRSASNLEALELAARQGGIALQEFQETIRRLEAVAARDDAALKALKAYVSKAPVAVALELAVKEADAEAALAGARAESEYTAAKLAEAQATQAEAQARWAEASTRHEAANEEVARLALELRSLEQALRNARGSATTVSTAAPAVAPTSPGGPHRYVIVAGAAILGAIIGMIVYFGLLTLRVYARELNRS